MAIKYSLPLNGVPDLKQKKVAFVADPTTTDAANTTAQKAIIDCLITYGMMATA